MNDEKMQTGAEYRIRTDIPNRFYTVFKDAETGEIIIGKTKSRLEMPAGGRRIISNIEELLNALPKKEGEETSVSEELMRKYFQTKVMTGNKKELAFDFELGCNCSSCSNKCELEYRGKIVALKIGDEKRYFVNERLS